MLMDWLSFSCHAFLSAGADGVSGEMERLVSEVSSTNPLCHGGEGLHWYVSSSLTLIVGAAIKLNASSSEPDTVRNGLRHLELKR